MVRSQWAGVKVLQQQSLAEHGSIFCCYKRKTWCVIVCNCSGVLLCSLRTDFSCLCWGCVAARMATWVVKSDGIWQEGSPSGTNRHHQKNGLGGATQECSAHSLCWCLSGFSRHTTFLEHLELNIPESYRKPTADSEKSRLLTPKSTPGRFIVSKSHGGKSFILPALLRWCWMRSLSSKELVLHSCHHHVDVSPSRLRWGSSIPDDFQRRPQSILLPWGRNFIINAHGCYQARLWSTGDWDGGTWFRRPMLDKKHLKLNFLCGRRDKTSQKF